MRAMPLMALVLTLGAPAALASQENVNPEDLVAAFRDGPTTPPMHIFYGGCPEEGNWRDRVLHAFLVADFDVEQEIRLSSGLQIGLRRCGSPAIRQWYHERIRGHALAGQTQFLDLALMHLMDLKNEETETFLWELSRNEDVPDDARSAVASALGHGLPFEEREELLIRYLELGEVQSGYGTSTTLVLLREGRGPSLMRRVAAILPGRADDVVPSVVTGVLAAYAHEQRPGAMSSQASKDFLEVLRELGSDRSVSPEARRRARLLARGPG